ncbi:ERF family protein [Streptomyces wedmorensis]|uniref:ERF family protein n=1 Tax=Streptomyces wedmorensis TaxID=43759 RepID=A0ABW6J7R6_STRWE
MTVTTLPTAQAPVPVAPPAPTATTAYEPAPAGTPADAPRVFTVIAAVMADAMPVGKDQKNTHQNYNFRGIDDVMSAMAGPMRKHGLFILPQLAHHQQRSDGKFTRALITMRYRIYGPAGDCLIAEIPGEAFDTADKSMNKAQSAALKYLLFTVFMLPVDGRSIDDGDRDHPVPDDERQPRQPQTRRQPQQRGQQRGQRQPQRQPQPEQPRRDYKAEAEAATSEAQFEQIRAEAVKAGAPPEYLASLDAIAEGKRNDARAPQRSGAGQPERSNRPAPASDATITEAQTGAAAEEALRLAASRAGYQTLDADFERAYGRPIAQADPSTIHAFRAMIEKAAQ